MKSILKSGTYYSTDEDARQAFMRNNGKIKEIQIKLMLSSRTEMQKVIESARNQSLAAFMPTAISQTALPALVPAVVPAAVPEVPRKSDSRERDTRSKEREKRRSRSKSRERKERCVNAFVFAFFYIFIRFSCSCFAL